MVSEAELIEKYFRRLGAVRGDVTLGIGDDAALLQVPANHELVLSTDTLVEGVHFPHGSAAHSIGHRALAVNLSDLAAMGAAPAWALLSLTLPAADELWLGEFARGFGALARAHDVALVGGNMCRGPLSITVQIAGLVPRDAALRRSGGKAGDLLCISGTVGDAGAGLAVLQGRLPATGSEWLVNRFEYPTPRVALGQRLRGIASACIDISDGLQADLARLAQASGCGATLELDNLPLSRALTNATGDSDWQYALAGGEDYELLIALPESHLAALQNSLSGLDTGHAVVGKLRNALGIELMRAGSVMQFSSAPFDHFRN